MNISSIAFSYKFQNVSVNLRILCCLNLAMGGKVSKSSLLEKYGTLLTSQEKVFINNSFEAITNNQEAEHFNEQHLQVRD